MRLRWIDALKGIGIILVVFAHHKLPVALDTYIFSFHMPLFFFGCKFCKEKIQVTYRSLLRFCPAYLPVLFITGYMVPTRDHEH